MPPAYVKPYVKRQKNDAADAEAICEAVTRANMRFVPTKTPALFHPLCSQQRDIATNCEQRVPFQTY
jgi:transposase